VSSVNLLLSTPVLFAALALLVWWTGTVRFALWAVGITCSLVLAVLLLVALVKMAGPAGFVIWGGCLILLLTFCVQLRRAKHRSLQKLITLAVEKGMPLPAVVQAFAADQGFFWRTTVSDLADHLGRGTPLSVAAEMSPGALSSEAIVAAEMGEATGDLAGALKQLDNSEDVIAPAQHALLGNVFYLSWPILFVPLLVAFLFFAIVPKLIFIFDDFGLALPPITVQVVRVIQSTPAWVATVALAVVIALAVVYVILCYAGVIPLPAIGLGRRFERSRVLRGLALAAGAHKPLGETLSTLARCYPKRSIGRRMENCAQEVNGGGNWIASLLKFRLISRRDAAVVESAQRLGNLPWALRELADSNERRLVYRLETSLNVFGPLVLLGWGVMILMISLAFFLPVVKIILALA
jgi:type II secretory pathway component PulF